MTSLSKRRDGSLAAITEDNIGTDAEATRISLPADGKYPLGLIEDYQRLALKSLTVTLTPDEESQLQELIAQITAIDGADPSTQATQARYEELDARLEQIRRKAEALLSARQ